VGRGFRRSIEAHHLPDAQLLQTSRQGGHRQPDAFGRQQGLKLVLILHGALAQVTKDGFIDVHGKALPFQHENLYFFCNLS